MGRATLDHVNAIRDAPLPGDWAELAACRRIHPTARPEAKARMFFPGREENLVGTPEWFRELCDACPVLEQCRDYSLAYPVLGLWAGMTEAQRRRIRAREKGQRCSR